MSKQPTKIKISQQALADFVTTMNEKPGMEADEIFKKFPEFENNPNTLQVAMDYHATEATGKYKTKEELNAKFPEFEITDSVKKKDSDQSSIIGLDQSHGSNYRQTVSELNGRISKVKELEDQAEKLNIAAASIKPGNDEEAASKAKLTGEYNEIVKSLQPEYRALKMMMPLVEEQKKAYQAENEKRQNKLFEELGIKPQDQAKIKADIFKAVNPDQAEAVDSGKLIPTVLDIDAEDLSKYLTGDGFDKAITKAKIRNERTVLDRSFGSFRSSVEKVLAFDLPSSGGGALANSLSYLRSRVDLATKRDPLIKAINAVTPDSWKQAVDDKIVDAQVALFDWADKWKNSDQVQLPISIGGLPILRTFKNDKELIQSLSQVKQPLDVIDFVFASAGQGAAQIIPSVLTRGGTSFVQEIGNNYLSGVAAIAKEKGISVEEVIKSGLDEPEIALQYGIVQGAMEKVAADKIFKGIGLSSFRDDIRNRALKFLKGVGDAGKTEFITEGLQSASQQIAIGEMTGLGKVDAVKNIDWLQVLDEAVAGAVGGSSVSAGGTLSAEAANKLAYFSNLNKRKDKDLTADEAEALKSFKESVISKAKEKYGDPRPEAEIEEFIEEEILPEIKPAQDSPGAIPPTESQEPIQPPQPEPAAVEATKPVEPAPAGIVGTVKRKSLGGNNKYDKIPDSNPEVIIMKYFANKGRVKTEEAVYRTGYKTKDLFGRVANNGASYHKIFEHVQEMMGTDDVSQDEVNAIIDDFLDGKTKPAEVLKKYFDGAMEKEYYGKIESEYEEILQSQGEVEARKYMESVMGSEVDAALVDLPEDVADEVVDAGTEIIETTLTDTERSSIDKVLNHYTENGQVQWEKIISDMDSGFEPVILDLSDDEYQQLKTRARQEINPEAATSTESEQGNIPPPAKDQAKEKVEVSTEQQQRALEKELKRLEQSLDKNLNENQQDMFGQNKTQSLFDDRAEQQRIVDEKKKELETIKAETKKKAEDDARAAAEAKGQTRIDDSPKPKSERIRDDIDDLFGELGDLLGDIGTLKMVNPSDGKRKPVTLSAEALSIGSKIVGKYIELGVVKFAEIAKDVYARYGEEGLRKFMDALKQAYAGVIVSSDVEGLTDIQTVKEFTADSLVNLFKALENDTSTASDLESDSSRDGANKQVGKKNVSEDGESAEAGAEKRSPGTGSTEVRGPGDISVSELIPPTDGSVADTGMDKQEQPRAVDERIGRGNNPRRNVDASGTGSLFGPESVETTPEADNAETEVRQTLKEKQAQQLQADKTTSVKVKDKQNIIESLPILIPHQHENVFKAETRFFSEAKPEVLGGLNKGILFTDATGTGKTFTGLGIVKRFDRMGLKRVLIVVPTEAKAKDWIKDASYFGMPVQELTGLKDAGAGADKVVTTYANFSQNQALIDRAMKTHFDLVLYDEAHKIVSNQQGDSTLADEAHKKITYSPDQSRKFAEAKYETQRQGDIQATGRVSKVTEDAITAEAKKLEGQTKVVFLSASPFAYHKNLTYADGYLFTLTEGEKDRSSAYKQFFVSNFGYRIRYNKLTEPEAGVDVSVMERQFHTNLTKAGAISSTRLVLDKDYSREFVLLDDKLGLDLDEGYKIASERKWANGQDKRFLPDIIRRKFDFVYKNQLLEAIKARLIISRVKEHLALGRKVILFHTYVNSIPSHPFDLMPSETNKKLYETIDEKFLRLAQDEVQRFHAENPKYQQLDLTGLYNPIETLKRAFGERVLMFNGSVPKAKRRDAMSLFNTDDSGKDIIVIQMDAGKEGISLHDVTGKMPRVMINLGLPYKPTDAIQTEGRPYRYGLMSDVALEYAVLHLNFEKTAFAEKINARVSTAEALAFGEEARNLAVTFKEGYKNPNQNPPGPEQGKGGKDSDSTYEVLSEFDRAITYYISRGKRNAKTKAREGTDYFATPEPLGYKMVEWLYSQPNDKNLEPSAGHGAIARFFSDRTSNKFIEPSYELRADLSINASGEVIAGDFETFNIVNKFDGIAMNPPFGTQSKTAWEHLEKAFVHLRDGGRVVAIVPDGPSMDKRIDAFFETKGSESIHHILTIRLPEVTFERAGTSVRTKILVYDKHENLDVAKKLSGHREIQIAAETYQELFDEIRDLEIPKRLPTQTRTVQEILERGTIIPKPGDKPATELVAGKHTKFGYPIWTIKLNQSFDSGDFKKFSDKAKELDGYYSSYKGNGALPGFIFKKEDKAQEFYVYTKNFQAGPSEVGDSFSNMVGNPSKGAAPLHAFETRAVAGDRGRMKIYQEVIDLAAKYGGPTIGQGNTARGALGTFYSPSENIRVKGLNALAVALHELTHAMDYRHQVIKKFIDSTTNGDPLRKQLTDVYVKYYPGAQPNHDLRKRMVEGYATLVQKYLEQPTEIKKDFPDLVKEFMTDGGTYYFRELGEFLVDAEEVITQYQGLDVVQKMASRIVNEQGPDPESFLTPMQKFTTEIFDRIYPFEVLAKRMGVHYTKDDISVLMRASNNALQIAEKNISSNRQEFHQIDAAGQWYKKHDYNYQTLVNSLNDKTEEFGAFLFARRIHFEFKELRKMERKLEKIKTPAYLQSVINSMQVTEEAAKKIIQTQIDDLEAQIKNLNGILVNEEVGEDEAKAAYQQLQKVFPKQEVLFDVLVNEDLEFAHHPLVQLLDKEGYDKFQDREGYAPFKRVWYDELVGGEASFDVPVVAQNKVSQFFKRRGSTKPVLNPLIGAMRNHAEVIRKGMRQMVYNKLIVVARANPDLFQTLDISAATGDEKKYIWARDNYKRVPILMDSYLKEVIDENYGYHNVSALERTAVSASQLFRTGTTGIFWQFFINNTFLDQAVASVNTRNGFIPFMSTFRHAVPAALSLASEKIMGRATLFPNSVEAMYLKEYLFLAGSSQTFLSADITSRKRLEDVIAGVDKSWKKRIQHYFEMIIRVMSAPGNASEILTRGTEYILARKAGKPQEVALEEAGRVSAPFHHMGRLKFGTGVSSAAYVRSVPYFNSSLQVFKQTKDSLNTPTGRKRYAFAALSMLAASVSAALVILGDDDDDDERKQLFKSIPADAMTKYLFLPNPYSRKRLLQVRVPEQIGFLTGLANMMMIEQAGETNYKWTEYGQAGTSFLPQQLNPFGGYQMIFSWTPQLIKPGAEALFNKKTFPAMRPIETQRDLALPEELRYNKYTLPVPIWLGDKLGLSPKMIQHLVLGYGGRAFKPVLGGNPFEVSDIFERELYFEASRQVQFYYDTKQDNDRKIKAMDQELIQYSDDEKNKILAVDDIVLDIDSALDDYRDLDEGDEIGIANARNEVFRLIKDLEKIVYN